MLDSRTATLPVEPHWIGESRTIRFAAGDAVALETVSLETGPVRPLSPVHLKAARQPDGTIALRWTRRSRADADGWGIAEPALEHVPEAWQVEIFDGGTPVRTLVSGSPTAYYALADQIVDFGGAASTFTFAVTQMSAVLGAGQAAMGAFNG